MEGKEQLTRIVDLASAVENLAELQQNKDENAEDRLRYVLAKMKIAHNAILQEKNAFPSH